MGTKEEAGMSWGGEQGLDDREEGQPADNPGKGHQVQGQKTLVVSACPGGSSKILCSVDGKGGW